MPDYSETSFDSQGGYPWPDNGFRIFAVDDDQPTVMIDELHESLGFSDLESEMELSRKAERDSENAE